MRVRFASNGIMMLAIDPRVGRTAIPKAAAARGNPASVAEGRARSCAISCDIGRGVVRLATVRLRFVRCDHQDEFGECIGANRNVDGNDGGRVYALPDPRDPTSCARAR